MSKLTYLAVTMALLTAPEFLRLLNSDCSAGLSMWSASAAETPVGKNSSAPGAASINRRAWDRTFLARLHNSSVGHGLRLELTGGKWATGTIRYIERVNGTPGYVSGDLDQPEKGRFFIQKQSMPGKAGEFFGVIEFPESGIGYRIEPTGPNGSSELVELPLDQIICRALPVATQEDTGEIPPLNPSEVPDYPIPAYQGGIISLQSLPGVVPVVYLDFRGGYTPTWGGIAYEKPNVSNAQIRDVWKRVAEDYMPFNINVTTDSRIYESAPENSRQRCVITPTSTAAPGAGGVAYIGSWNSTGDTPCWVFMVSGKACAEAVSHEVGHTLQLGHDGQTTGVEYYGGQGSGAVGWAPIMGVGYYQNVSQWSKGEYQNANNKEDDLAKIVSNNNSVDYRTDDTGPNLATSRYLEIWNGNAASAQGVIETTGDTDAFRFTTAGGTVSLKANPVGDWGNLAMMATLWSSSDTLIASNNPQTTLAPLIAVSVQAGTYTFRLTGTGRNNVLTDGFSPYASLGYYSVTGTVANARMPNRFAVAENSPYGTVAGIIPFSNPDNHLLIFAITSGNTSSAFALDNTGRLIVANPAALNYENLARNTQLPVQYELFVTITDLADATRTETGRRVVVAVQDLNEAPTAPSFTTTVLEHTRPGTVIGKVTGSDPDYYDTLTYRLVDGDPNNSFSVRADTGEVLVQKDLLRSQQTMYQLRIRVADQGAPMSLAVTSMVTVNVLANNTGFTPGSIKYAAYQNISGNAVSALTSSPNFPSKPSLEKTLYSFEAESNWADNFGSTIRGYLIPPASGSYTFWIASDDNSELWISTSSSSANMVRIAYVSDWTNPREWNKFSTQRSAARSLVGGQAYYIEARQKEGSGGDNLAVAWAGPTMTGTNVIAGAFLAPYSPNYTPVATGFTGNVRRDAFQGARIGHIDVNEQNAQDVLAYQVIGGNSEGIFSVDSSGWIRVADSAALQGTFSTSFSLSVQVTDSGTPALSSLASVTINLVEANEIVPTTVQREMFMNISGTTVANLTTSSKYPGRLDSLTSLTAFDCPVNVAENFGSRVRGYVTPPTTGDYRFYIASDDGGELKLSTSENPGSATVIASVRGATDHNQWTKEANQTSAVRTLTGGTRYYIEALQKEGGGGDHLSVAWTGPDFPSPTVIDGGYLTPADINTVPQMLSQAFSVYATAPAETVIGRLQATDSPLDTLTFKLISGDPANTFRVEPDGALILADPAVITNGATTFSLICGVQDSGLGGLYPLRSAQALVTVNVATPGTAFIWTGAGTDEVWDDANNWRGVLPGPTNGLVFGLSSLQANSNNLLTAANWIQFTNSNFKLFGNPLVIAAGITNAGTNTLGLDTVLGADQTWQSSSGLFTAQGSVSNAGFTLRVVANSDFRLAGQVLGEGGLIKTGTSRLLMDGAYAYSGPTIIAAASGTTAALEVDGLEDLDISRSDLTLSGRMNLGSHNATVGALNGAGIVYAGGWYRGLTIGANGHDGVFSGTLQNSSGGSGVTLGVAKVGRGSQVLNGVNSYSGDSLVNDGVLIAGNAAALGSAAGATLVGSGATLALIGNISISAEPLRLGGVGFDGTGALRNDSGLNTFNGPVTLSAPALIRAAAGRVSMGGSWDTRGYTATFSTDAGSSIVISSAIGGSGGLVKDGPGELYFYGNNTFTGQSRLLQGTTFLSGSGTLASQTISISPGAILNVANVLGGWVLTLDKTLDGSGNIAGNASIFGTVTPVLSGSFGILNFGADLNLHGNAVMKVAKISGVTTNDVVVCAGTLSQGGQLTVSNVGGEALVIGDSFRLFNSAVYGSGAFTNFALPPLAEGLTWDTSQLPVNGTMAVAKAEPSTPPSLAVAQSAGQLTISWPTDYSNYVLTTQTNAPGEGLGPSWHPVTGVTSNAYSISLDQNVGSVYFRLIKQ